MKKIAFLAFATLVLSNSNFAQKDTLKNVEMYDTSVHIQIWQGIIENYSSTEFLIWNEEPDSFSFRLYSRWGIIVGESSNPHFFLTESIKPDVFLKSDVYVYKFSYVKKDHTRHEKIGHITIMRN